MNEYRSLFAHNLKRLMTKNGWTNSNLARVLQVSTVTLARWKMGESAPQEKYINAMASLFDVEIRELWKPVRKPYSKAS